MENCRKRIEQAIAIVITFVLCLNIALSSGTTILPEGDVPLSSGALTLEGVSDFSNWRSGHYNWTTGKYGSYSGRICLKEYIEVSQKAILNISVSDTSYGVLIRELDASYQLINSFNSSEAGNILELHDDTRYLGISLYNPKNSKISFQAYETLFNSGFEVTIQQEVVEQGTGVSLDLSDLSDFGLWRSGNYDYATGVYVGYAARICLNDYVEAGEGKTFTVHLSDESYNMLIRLLDEEKHLIESYNLRDGETLVTSADTKYIGVSVYAPANGGLTYGKYQELFANGLVIGLEENEDGNKMNPEDLSDFGLWRSGHYDNKYGKFAAMATRICLNDYVEVEPGKTYTVRLSLGSYNMLIRLLDQDMNMLESYNLKDGETFTAPSNSSYAGISIYAPSIIGLNYEKYRKLFVDEVIVALEKESDSMDPVVDVAGSANDEILVDNVAGIGGNIGSDSLVDDIAGNTSSSLEDILNSTTMTNEEALKEIAFYLMDNGITDAYDVSKYNFTFSQLDKLTDEVLKGRGKVQAECGSGMYFSNTRTASNRIATITLKGVDAGYMTRLQNTKQAISEVEAFVKNNSTMTDLEKVLYVHEYVCDTTTYGNKGVQSARAGGVLGDHVGVCEGYEKAMALLLERLDISTVNIVSFSMNHSWLQVQLDGEWYHMDPTWDDEGAVNDGKMKHQYFLKTDAEYTGVTKNRHYNWKNGYTSTSTKFSDWFVHDVMGRMYYADEFWYYVDPETGYIVKSKIDGSEKEELVTNGTTRLITKFENGTLSYTVDGVSGTIAY